MKRLFVLAVALAALVAPASAAAHPLGNFTVNRYSELELSGDRVYVRYVLDMAEVPAFQERQRIRDRAAYAAALARRIGRGLKLMVGGEQVGLTAEGHALAFPPGVAGLRTLRFEAVYATPPLGETDGPVRLEYRDRNFQGRLGWKEIVLRASGDAQIASSGVPDESISNGLLAYPDDLLESPLDVTSAGASIVPAGPAGAPPRLRSRSELESRAAVRAAEDDAFARLIAEDELDAGFVALALLVALFWGAVHALSPGHGKAIVAGYLIGSRGTPRHAVALGLIVTVTHTIGVFALGLVTLALSEIIVPDQLYPWLNLVSALLVVGVGLTILRWRLRSLRRQPQHHHHDHGHDHGHHHDHHHHHHDQDTRGLLGIGVSAGIIPCPTALVVLLAAISLHRIGFGLVLIVAFSIGLAAAVTAIGLVAVTAKHVFGRMSFEGPVIRALPTISALVVIGLGAVMTARALPKVL